MKQWIVIAGFAWIWKTTLAKKYSNVVDIESTPYKYDYSELDTYNAEEVKGKEWRNLNKDFPTNYIEAIKKAQKEFDIVLVRIHPEEALPQYDKSWIDYYLCFPTKEALNEYEIRFRERWNNETYIRKVIDSYDKRYQQFKNNPHKKIELSIWETLEDVLLNKDFPLIQKKIAISLPL